MYRTMASTKQEAKHLATKTYPTDVVEARQHVFISQAALGNNTTISADLSSVYFTPDEVIVRAISYSQTAGNNTGWFVYSDLTNGFIGSFLSGQINNPNLTVKLRKPVTDRYNFYIYDRSGANLALVNAPDATGLLTISLEFVKYG